MKNVRKNGSYSSLRSYFLDGLFGNSRSICTRSKNKIYLSYSGAGKSFGILSLHYQTIAVVRQHSLLFCFAKLAENVGFGIDKLKSWKQLTRYSVDIHSEIDYATITFGIKDTFVDENGLENEERRQKKISKFSKIKDYFSVSVPTKQAIGLYYKRKANNHGD